MPVIQFDDNDYLAATPAEAGWQPARITSLDTKASSSGKGTNTFIEFTVTNGKLKGKIFRCAVSSANPAGNSSLLGGMMWYARDVFLQLAAAINNTKLSDVPKTLDLDTIKDRDLDIKIGVDTTDGAIKNPVIGFAPFGTGTAQASAATPF